MTKSYINKIKANIDIYASKKTVNVLDGTYTSVFTGRSMNFEDLRDYVPGDSMRDIEWKAYARSGKLLVKRFVAEKKHNMLFLVDTSVRMLGETNTGESKKELALYSFGTLAYLAYKNGDTIGAAYMNGDKPNFEPFRTGINNIERLINQCEKAIDSNSLKKIAIKKKSKTDNITSLINSVVFRLKKRMVIFIITDLKGASEINEDVLRRIKCVHDVLFIITDDAKITKKKERKTPKDKRKQFDLASGGYLPAFITENRRLIKLEDKKRQEEEAALDKKCKKAGISKVCVTSLETLTKDMISLLQKHKYEARVKS